MSKVCNYSLFTTLLNEWLGETENLHALKELNGCLARERENDQQQFNEVHEYAGGPKSLPAYCYMLAGNHIPLRVVAKAILKVPWRYPEGILLIYSNEEDDAFQAFNIDKLSEIANSDADGQISC
jgi:hypothetical protein